MNKMAGLDKFYLRSMKGAKNEIKSLSALFKKSLATGKVLDKWKSASVMIFYKGTKSLPRNYCPISLTSVVGKLMETII